MDIPPSLPPLAGVTPTVKRVPAGSALFRRGDPATAVFRIASGTIRLIRYTVSGAEVPVHSPRPGDLFAEAALFSAHYHCDAIASTDSVVLAYAKAQLAGRLREDEAAMWDFAADMAHRLQGLRTQVETMRIRTAEERILHALRLRADKAGRWTPPGTLKEFAQELGLTHEALYRALARLEDEGRLVRQGRELHLP